MLETLTPYPQFVPNQVLTNTQLNQLREHLDGQERLTRQRLVGMGIVCGFEFRVLKPGGSARRIALTEGLGLTSDGYLICASAATYTHVRRYVDPDTQDDGVTPEYEKWRAGANQIAIRELLPTGGGQAVPDGATLLTTGMLAQGVIVLYLEREPVDLKSCFITECESNGVNIRWNLRVLLVPRSRLSAIAPCPDPPVPLRVPRLHTRLSLPAVRGAADIDRAYETIVRQALVPLVQGIRDAFDRHGAFLGIPANYGQQIEDAIGTKVTAVPTGGMNQYHYDWLKDVTYAYNEAIAGVCGLVTGCCPQGDFSRHLMVGAESHEGFRHGFRPSPVRDSSDDDLERVRRLFWRLRAMAVFLDFGQAAGLRLTPSRVEGEPLGRRAVPHYYDFHTPWSRSTWQPKLCCTTDPLWSYADVADQDIDFDDYGRASLVRIEGHLRMAQGAAVAEITAARGARNAEFCLIRTNFDDPSDALSKLDDKLKDLLFGRAKLASKERRLTAIGVATPSFPTADITALTRDITALEKGMLELARAWSGLRRSRELHCDVAHLETLYVATRAELVCVFSGLSAELTKIVEGVDRLKSVLAERGQLTKWHFTGQQQQMQLLVDAWLPRKLGDFNYSIFIHRYKELIQSLNDSWLLWGVHGFPVTGSEAQSSVPRPWPAGAAAISASLLSLTRGCFHTRLARLSLAFAEMWREDYSFFPNLAAAVDGLEHLAGVEKGGAFVLVSDRDAPNSPPTVRSDFSLACCLPCCCDVDLDDLCLPTVALPEHRVAILEEVDNGRFKPVDMLIDLRNSGFDPNLDRVTGDPAGLRLKVDLPSGASDMGARLVFAEDGIVRYVLPRPTPGLIDSFEFTLESSGECRGVDTGRVSILMELPPKEVERPPIPEPEPEPDPRGTVTGVVHLDGKILDRITVFIEGQGIDRTSITRSGGKYGFADLKVGDYVIGIVAEAFMIVPVAVRIVEGRITQDLPVELRQRLGTVTVAVLDGARKFIENSTLALRGGAEAFIGEATGSGVHTFSAVPAGRYVAVGGAPGFSGTSIDVSVRPGEDVSTFLMLSPRTFSIPDRFVHRIAAASGTVTATAREDAKELYGKRYAERYESIEKTADSGDLHGIKAYKRAEDFMIEVLPSAETPIEVVAESFEGIRDSLARRIARTATPPAEKKALTAVLRDVSLAFMDRVTIDAPDEMTPRVTRTVARMGETFDRLDIDRARFAREWKAEDLARLTRSETPMVLRELVRVP